MSTLVRLILICTLITNFLRECDGYYADTTNRKIRIRISGLIRELYVEADTKLESILYMRRYFGRTSRYHLAESIYNCRKLLETMVEIYEHFHDQHTTKTLLQKSEMMTEVYRLYMEIDHLVQMCVEFDKTDPSGTLFGRMGTRPEENDKFKLPEEALRRARKEKIKNLIARKKMEWDMKDGNKTLTLMKDYNRRDLVEEGFISEFEK